MRSLYTIILVAILCVSDANSETETQEAEEVVEHKDRPELQQCRDANKGKWCTCRKLLKFVEKQIGKVLGIYIPSVRHIRPLFSSTFFNVPRQPGPGEFHSHWCVCRAESITRCFINDFFSAAVLSRSFFYRSNAAGRVVGV